MDNVDSTMHNVNFTMNNVDSTMKNVIFTMSNVDFTMDNVIFTMNNVDFTFSNVKFTFRLFGREVPSSETRSGRVHAPHPALASLGPPSPGGRGGPKAG